MGNPNKVTVFRFRYFDRATGQTQTSDDFATAAMIAQIGATIVEGTAMEVEPGEVSINGLMRRKPKAS